MNSSFSVKLNCVLDRVHSTHLIYVVYVDFFFFSILFTWFIFGCAGSLLLHQSLSRCGEGRLLFVAGHRLLIAAAFSLQSRALGVRASVVVECRLRSLWCTDSGAPEVCGNLPGPGIEPASPALAGGFLTTGPPGESSFKHVYIHFKN